MPETCTTCGGTGKVPTRHEELVSKMGEEATALVEAGWQAIRVTGTPFTLSDGRRVMLPGFAEIERISPKGVEFNDCYAWCIGTLLKTGTLPIGEVL